MTTRHVHVKAPSGVEALVLVIENHDGPPTRDDAIRDAVASRLAVGSYSPIVVVRRLGAGRYLAVYGYQSTVVVEPDGGE